MIQPVAEAPVKQSLDGKTRPLQILLVEDEDDDAYFFRHALSRLGFQGVFQRVNDGVQGLCYIQGQGAYADRDCYPVPNLIVSDLKMPGMDGLEFTRQVRAYPQHQQTPILILSSSNLDQDQQTGLEAGANRYLVKPLSLAEWDRAVQDIIAFALEALAPGIRSRL